jgi:DNA-directed RNA polymerase subunit RPC12/RpoP
METLIKTNKGYQCPHCKEILEVGTLKYSQQGDLTYMVALNNDGSLDFERDEFFSDDTGEFYCANCGRSLFGYDEKLAEKILQGSDER